MSRDHKGQRGAILVLTAFLLPFIIAFTGMAVDLGRAYVYQSRLQNAADAAVLAGCYQIDNDNKTNETVKTYLGKNLQGLYSNDSLQKGDAFPDNAEALNYNYTINDKKDTLDVTVRGTVETVFLKVLNIKEMETIDVKAFAEAKRTVDAGEKPDFSIFDYALSANHESSSTYNLNNNNDAAIWFSHEGNLITGNIATNGKITFAQNQGNVLKGKIYASENVKKQGSSFLLDQNWEGGVNKIKLLEPDVWGSYGWPSEGRKGILEAIFEKFLEILGFHFEEVPRDMAYYTFRNIEGSPFTTEEYHKSNNPAIDAYLHDDSKPDRYKDLIRNHYVWQDVTNQQMVIYGKSIQTGITANPGIDAWIKNYQELAIKNSKLNSPNMFYDADNQIFYGNTNYSLQIDEYPLNGSTYFNPSDNGKDYHSKVIIANKDIKIDVTSTWNRPKDNDFVVVISLEGNIDIEMQHDFNGIIYAPKGRVLINGTDGNRAKFQGSVVAKQVQITSDFEIVHKNFLEDEGGDVTPGKTQVQLTK